MTNSHEKYLQLLGIGTTIVVLIVMVVFAFSTSLRHSALGHTFLGYINDNQRPAGIYSSDTSPPFTQPATYTASADGSCGCPNCCKI